MTTADPTDQTRALEALIEARAHYDNARATLMSAIHAALVAGWGPSAVSHASRFSREYIARIRDGNGPKR